MEKLEIEAVSKALAVLSGDAHDLFTRTFIPDLLQVDRQDARRSQAANLLSDIAKKLNNPKLSNLAYRVCLDAFTRVKKAIDDMVAQLLKEKRIKSTREGKRRIPNDCGRAVCNAETLEGSSHPAAQAGTSKTSSASRFRGTQEERSKR